MPATPVRQVRVFISSTFRDMNSERDHLVTVVFPELRDRVERLGFESFDVDLRWGGPHEDLGERANSWAYCKRWIDEVEPFFVCMLGQRYGWRPPAEEISAGAAVARRPRERLVCGLSRRSNVPLSVARALGWDT